MSTRHELFTLIFRGDLTKFRSNPFHVDTPFGRPIACGLGSAFDEVEDKLAAVESFEAFAAKVADLALNPPKDGDEVATLERLISDALQLFEDVA